MNTEEDRILDKKGFLVLPEIFTHRNFSYKQLDRIKNVAIYQVIKKGSERKWWDVVKIQSHDKYVIADKIIPAAETYPNNEDWGNVAWTFIRKQDAFNKFDSLVG